MIEGNGNFCGSIAFARNLQRPKILRTERKIIFHREAISVSKYQIPTAVPAIRAKNSDHHSG